jgi:hypothetical protein
LADAVIWHEEYDQAVAADALYRAHQFAIWISSVGVDKLLEHTQHTGGHSCARYGWTDPDAAKRASAAFNDIVA